MLEIIGFIICAIGIVLLIIHSRSLNYRLQTVVTNNIELIQARQEIENQNKQLQEDYRKLMAQKKSSEITTGLVVEQIAPILNEFKYNPQICRFIGTPIDYMVFGDEEIVFLEVKSANSNLTAKQRKIKSLVRRGKVRWEELQISGIQNEEENK